MGTPQTTLPLADDAFLVQVTSYINEHLHESDLTSLKLAEEFCLSQRHFNRRIKALVGLNTTLYIRNLRICKARTLLTETNLPISHVYTKCGFETPSYFSRVFHEYMGITPTDYRCNRK